MLSTCAIEREGSPRLINVTILLSFISTFSSLDVPPYTDNNQLHNGMLSKSKAILTQEGEQKRKME